MYSSSIDVIFNAGEPSSFFLFDTYSMSMLSLVFKALCTYISVLPSSTSRMVPSILRGGQSGVYPFDDIPAVDFGLEKFSRLSEILFF